MTASNYPNVLPVTLKFEGGKVNNPKDPGGRTNEGVIQRVYDAYRKKKGLPLRSVYLMENHERDEIYENEYWRPSSACDQPNGLDLMVFDYSVNSGVSRGRAALAQATGKTVAERVTRYADIRLSFLRRLGTFKTFGKGWTSRVATCEARALRMAAASSVIAAEPTASAGLIEASVKSALIPAAQAHELKASNKKNAAHATGAAGTVAATPAAATSHTSIAIAVIAIVVIAVAVGAFIAWQHSVRAAAIHNEVK